MDFALYGYSELSFLQIDVRSDDLAFMPVSSHYKTALVQKFWQRHMVSVFLTIAGLAIIGSSCSALAETTTTYKYDPRGRLITSTQTTPQGATVTSISHDAASNRKTYSVSGATGSGSGGNPSSGAASPTNPNGTNPPAPRFVVVPLNGFMIIPIG